MKIWLLARQIEATLNLSYWENGAAAAGNRELWRESEAY